MELYILKNKYGLYWGNENHWTTYSNAAKTYTKEDALKAAYRKGCVVCIAKCKTVNADNRGYTCMFFIEDGGEINI